jgi:CheY-like chemotaxis protein
MSTDIEQCMAVGMNAHISKPIDENDMIHKILSQLHNAG